MKEIDGHNPDGQRPSGADQFNNELLKIRIAAGDLMLSGTVRTFYDALKLWMNEQRKQAEDFNDGFIDKYPIFVTFNSFRVPDIDGTPRNAARLELVSPDSVSGTRPKRWAEVFFPLDDTFPFEAYNEDDVERLQSQDELFIRFYDSDSDEYRDGIYLNASSGIFGYNNFRVNIDDKGTRTTRIGRSGLSADEMVIDAFKRVSERISELALLSAILEEYVVAPQSVVRRDDLQGKPTA